MTTHSSPANIDTPAPDGDLVPSIIQLDSTAGQQEAAGDRVVTDAMRDAAYHGIHTWQGKRLEPFSIGREALFNRVRVFVAPTTLRLPEVYAPEYLQEAVLVLFLCSCGEGLLNPIRHSADLVIDAANVWGEKNIPRNQRQAAGELAFKIIHEENLTIAVPMPDGSGKPLGN